MDAGVTKTAEFAEAIASLPQSTPPGASSSDEPPTGFNPLNLDKTVIAIPLLAQFKMEDKARRELEAQEKRRREGQPGVPELTSEQQEILTPEVYDVIIDLNLGFKGGRVKAKQKVKDLVRELIASIGADKDPTHQGVHGPKTDLSEQYVFASLEGKVIRALVEKDCGGSTTDPDRAIFHIWPDFEVNALTIRSVKTVKADAARIAYAALGDDIVWAVLDSGIQGDHPHFRDHANLVHDSALRHKDFTSITGTEDDDESARRALLDEFGHGTHVAGIIAGEQDLEKERRESTRFVGARAPAGGRVPAMDGGVSAASAPAATTATSANVAQEGTVSDAGVRASLAGAAATVEAPPVAEPPVGTPPVAAPSPGAAGPDAASQGETVATDSRNGEDSPRAIRAFSRFRDQNGNIKFEPLTITRISGMAPMCKLLSLKVLNDKGKGKASNIIAAIEYIQRLNGYGRHLVIHGVNLSVGYEFEPEWFACGQSPLCVEVDRLVRTGVIVVVAAGNTGYGWIEAKGKSNASAGMDLTINDPGNAELAITVGSTHRDMPHIYGVSYFSSKGPTGDGRLKPDLVAPGEKILSCAAGKKRADAFAETEQDCDYVEDSGTSMAAPHVSGVIAAFLSIRREFMGQSERVKEIFLSTCTDLKRERSFQGHGLVDLIRAIQSV